MFLFLNVYQIMAPPIYNGIASVIKYFTKALAGLIEYHMLSKYTIVCSIIANISVTTSKPGSQLFNFKNQIHSVKYSIDSIIGIPRKKI